MASGGTSAPMPLFVSFGAYGSVFASSVLDTPLASISVEPCVRVIDFSPLVSVNDFPLLA